MLSIPGGTRTHSLWIRSPARYPLRHGDSQVHLGVTQPNNPFTTLCKFALNEGTAHSNAGLGWVAITVLLRKQVKTKNDFPRRGIEPRPRR